MNNRYTIKVGHPLLRPGLEIETEASEQYVVAVVKNLMDVVRRVNNDTVVVKPAMVCAYSNRPHSLSGGDP